jgi:hypothetical protein
MIYFAQPPEGGPIKIGFSANVEARIRQLEAHYGRSLAVLATMDGGRETEREIHERFAHIQLKGPGSRGNRLEQFKPTADLMAFIGLPMLVGANPNAVEAMKPVHLVTIIVLKGTQAQADWLETASHETRISKADITRLALIEWAKERGLKPPPSFW